MKTPQPINDSTEKSGTLQVDELTAQRALERGLVNEGNLLLGAGQMELVPNFSYQRFEFDGATAVQVGTANFYDPAATGRIIEGMKEYLCQQNEQSVRDIIGTLQTGMN